MATKCCNAIESVRGTQNVIGTAANNVVRYVVKVTVNVEGREHRVAVGFAIFNNDPLADRRPRA